MKNIWVVVILGTLIIGTIAIALFVPKHTNPDGTVTTFKKASEEPTAPAETVAQ